MSYFDKFTKDLEKRKEIEKARRVTLEQDEKNHTMRDRVRLYAERWQNSIRYGVKKK